MELFFRLFPDWERCGILGFVADGDRGWDLRTQDVLRAFSKAKQINGGRVRFEITGGDYRLIAAFNWRRQIAFVKFLGTHAEYDDVEAATVAQF